MIPLRRGVLRLDGGVIARTDPFGLFRSLHNVDAPQSVLILPKLYTMPPFELPGSTRYQQGGVSLASSVGESEEFVSLREYRPGDPLRKMHWKSFAKAGKPIVKEFQDEFFVRHAHDPRHVRRRSAHRYFRRSRLRRRVARVQHAEPRFAARPHVRRPAGLLLHQRPRSWRTCSKCSKSSPRCNSVSTKNSKRSNKACSTTAPKSAARFAFSCQWDEARKRLVRALSSRGIPLRVFVITDGEAKLDPGPLAHEPTSFRVSARRQNWRTPQ